MTLITALLEEKFRPCEFYNILIALLEEFKGPPRISIKYTRKINTLSL